MSRFLIVNTDYSGFLTELYAGHPGLEHASYEGQLAVRNGSLFGVSDFYPRNLVDLGHPAVEFSINNRAMQTAWAREHGLKLPATALRDSCCGAGFCPGSSAINRSGWNRCWPLRSKSSAPTWC